MSFKIKPEDVPAKLAIELQDYVSGVTIHAYRHNISYILTAAIEAGLVSPPVKACRWISGGLATFKQGEPLLYKGDTTYIEATEHFRYEHWKGQTE